MACSNITIKGLTAAIKEVLANDKVSEDEIAQMDNLVRAIGNGMKLDDLFEANANSTSKLDVTEGTNSV